MAKSKTKKPSAKQAKPKKVGGALPLVGVKRAIARPVLTLPATNSSVLGNTDLNVAFTTNVVNIRYQVLVTDISGAPPFPEPFIIDLFAKSTVVMTTIPGANLPPNGTFQIRVRVHPDDAITGDLDDSINITTDLVQTADTL